MKKLFFSFLISLSFFNLNSQNFTVNVENIKEGDSILVIATKSSESLIKKWINKSIEKANLNHIRGKDLTPFLITEINALSKNKTLEANIALIINNALLAGKISKKFNS